jgi:hypothetical protein
MASIRRDGRVRGARRRVICVSGRCDHDVTAAMCKTKKCFSWTKEGRKRMCQDVRQKGRVGTTQTKPLSETYQLSERYQVKCRVVQSSLCNLFVWFVDRRGFLGYLSYLPCPVEASIIKPPLQDLSMTILPTSRNFMCMDFPMLATNISLP